MKAMRVIIVVLGSFILESFDGLFGYSFGYPASRLIAAHADCLVAVVSLSEVGKAALDRNRLGGDSAGISNVCLVDRPGVRVGEIEILVRRALLM